MCIRDRDSPYDPAVYQDGIGACPAVTVTVAVSNDFAASNPEYCEFLSNFSMSSALISEALAYMQELSLIHIWFHLHFRGDLFPARRRWLRVG